MRRLLVLIVVLILYGSFYPFHFAFPSGGPGPLALLLHSWVSHLDSWALRDLFVNIAIYVPLGMVGHLATRKSRVPLASYWAPQLLGMVLSSSVELLQYFEPVRDVSLNDFVNNTLGTALGIGCGMLFERLAGPNPFRGIRLRPVDRGALLFVFLWVGYLIFPVFPITALRDPLHKFDLFLASPVFNPLLFLSGLASWYVAGRVIGAAGARRATLWLSLLLIAFPAQLWLDGRQPVRAGFLGAIAGTLLFMLAGSASARGAGKLEASAWLALLVYRGLSPFHFGPPQPFAWLPFAGFLNNDWQTSLMVLIEKAWYYGVAVWLLRASGMRLAQSAALVAVVLAAIEGIQTRLPGRVAEITDPLLALIMAFVLATLYRGRAATRRLSVSPSASPHRAPSDKTART